MIKMVKKKTIKEGTIIHFRDGESVKTEYTLKDMQDYIVIKGSRARWLFTSDKLIQMKNINYIERD